ncbi:MAG: PIN domain nuclease [Candidatus Omnitrophica bacterium]|nr:PIN domain nuclease [Candidatus Omnitrophota bacterium]
MDLRFVRIGFLIISAILGSQLVGQAVGWPFALRLLVGAAAGAILILIEAAIHRVGRVSIRGFSAAVFGLLFGLIMAKLVSDAVALIPLDLGTVATVRVALTWAFCYLGMVMALRGRDEFSVIIPYVRLVRHDRGEELRIVDTSAVIDGRLLDLCQTRFIEGRLIIPRFVLKELQAVADSSDPIKRSRGRRGLEVLKQLQSLATIDVKIHEEDLPGIAEIDAKLVKLAQVLGTRVITNDYNLNKVAELQGVGVLNVNELAQALRPVVLPGETLEVKPIKEGKEHHQAVAYLDDGTMVVVENGRALIGQSIRGLVTSVLQTAAGRMVFVRPETAPPLKR